MTPRDADRLWALALGVACAAPARAHPPHVEGWKPLASLAVAALGAAVAARAYRSKTGSGFAATGAGVGVFVVLLVGGLIASFVSSL